ncbi:hypothetical protein SFR_3115 [Streptomyces sp. FR-008]|nr:hypothetical protein SFR_3115 [Streptomyces sp. FR-008]
MIGPVHRSGPPGSYPVAAILSVPAEQGSCPDR